MHLKTIRNFASANRLRLAVAVLLLCLVTGGNILAGQPATLATGGSPENQVFQFMHSGVCTNWADGSQNQASAYLWISENCQHVRGLLILCANVPEHRLVGEPVIREVCARHDLGIVWCVPSFMNFRKNKDKGINDALDYQTSTTFLQNLLNGLAKTSGYDEVATVPWLPIGESGHLLMVDALVEQHPERCIAGVWLKNNHLPPHNRTVPALVAYGVEQQWSQEKTDIRTNWSNIGAAYLGVLNQRQQNPDWPLSYLIDGSSGHFSCLQKLTRYVAHYIDIVAAARLSDDGSANLKPVDLTKGFLADMPVPGYEGHPVTPFVQTLPEARALPWFFDRESAAEAQSFAAMNWAAKTQLPAFADGQGNVLPFDFNGIQDATPQMEPDGISFVMKGMKLDRLPANFVGAGEPLPHTSGPPETEWLCGQVKPLDEGHWQVYLDRSWPSGATYLASIATGSMDIRTVIQPCHINLKKNDAGQKQTIAFAPIADVPMGTKSVRLTAKSSANLPVRFFVRAGPAVIHGDELVFTPVPPRSQLPLTVMVDAWQWGRATAPAVQTAPLAEQQFKLLPAK